MNDKKHIHRKIYADCIRATAVPVLLYGLQEVLEGLLTVRTAGILGQFADAVFRLDFAFGQANLWKLLVCIAATVLLIPFINVFSNIFMIKYALLHDRMVLGRFLDKEYAAVLACDAGDLQHRLEWEPTDLRCNFVNIVTDLAKAAVTLSYLLYSALAVSPLYTAIVFAVSMVKLTVPIAVRKLEKKYDMETREYQSKVRSFEEEMIRQPHVVKQYGLADALTGRLDRAYRMYFDGVQRKSIRCGRIAGGISAFLETFCTFAVLLSGAVLTANGRITPGTVAAMVGYFGVFGSVIGTFGTVIRTFPKMKNNAERMEIFYERGERTGGAEPADVRGLRAENLSFAYETGSRPVLDGVEFELDLRGKTAVCGTNGSGKSTLIGVLCGLLSPYGGKLCADGTDLAEISPDAWRKRIAYVPQEAYLFAGTVRENVRLGRPSAPDAEVDAVMTELGIAHLADRTVTAGTDTLSGGEKQKISIARALLKDAPVMILDEPGNNLDAETVGWLKKFLAETEKGVIYITHDTETERLADAVIRM